MDPKLQSNRLLCMGFAVFWEISSLQALALFVYDDLTVISHIEYKTRTTMTEKPGMFLFDSRKKFLGRTAKNCHSLLR